MQNGTVFFSQQECSRRTKYILGLQPMTHAAIFTSLSPPSASHPEVSDASASGILLSARRDIRTSVRLDPEDSMLSVILCQTHRDNECVLPLLCGSWNLQPGKSRGWEGCEAGREDEEGCEAGGEDEEGELNEFQGQLPTFCSKVR